MKLAKTKPRWVPEELLPELSNLWHLSKVPHLGSRHQRLVRTANEIENSTRVNEWQDWDQAEINWQREAYEQEQREEWAASSEKSPDGLAPDMPHVPTFPR